MPVTVVRPGAVRLDFYDPPASGEAYYVSISPAVPTQPQEGEIYTYEVLTDANVWVFEHNMHRIVTVQTFNQNGVEIIGDVRQDITSLDKVTVEFNHPMRGTMVVR